MPTPETLTAAGVSAREAEVLGLVAERATNAEIAARLFVSVRTVESHVSSLLRKLGVSDRRALARLANGAASTTGTVAGLAILERRPDGDDDGSTAHVGPATSPARALPVPLTSFVGRAVEVAALTAAVESHRLVTAVGPGGVGKTRLSTAVAATLAASRADGVWFVDLMPVSDDALIATAVCNTLGLGDPLGRTVADAVLAHLADREALLVLDNCEHLVSGAAVFVERLLAACPGVSVLATSQARLMLPFEWTFPVPGLSLPDGAAEGDAVALFVERARQADAGEVADDDRGRIGEICRRLDGGALAIELAAARLPSLGLDGIEQGLSERFRLLSGGPRLDERHQSLRSTIDWSYDLLGPRDRALLRRVSVFAAPFTVDAAALVAGDGPDDRARVADGLARLTEHSLLVASPGAETRYRVLDTIRQYGLERMAASAGPTDDDPDRAPDELALVRGRHLRWTIDALVVLDARVDLPLATGLARAEEFSAWRTDVDRVADDARAALRWAAGQLAPRGDAHALAVSLAGICFTRGLLAESQRRYQQAAELADDGRVAAQLLLYAGGAATGRQVGDEALTLWRAAADRAIAAGDGDLGALALARAAELILRGPGIIADRPAADAHTSLIAEARDLAVSDPRAEAAILTARVFEFDEVDAETLALAEQAVRVGRELGDPVLESGALDALSAVHLGLGDVPEAVAAVRRRIDLLSGVRPTAVDAFEFADAYGMATEIALTAGDFRAARGYADTLTHLPFHSEEGHLATSRRLKVDALAGDLDRVLVDAERFRRGWHQAGRPAARSLAGGAYAVALAHGLRGDDAAQAEWMGITAELGVDMTELGGCSTAYAPAFDAIVSLHRGDATAAVERLADDPAAFRRWHTGEWRPWYAALHAEAAVLAGHGSGRERIRLARPLAAPNPTAAALVERAEALAESDTDRLVALAGVLADTGCRYQWVRTLILAGGDHAAEGRRQMSALGAAPMVEPARA